MIGLRHQRQHPRQPRPGSSTGGAHESSRAQHRADTAAAIERYAARSRALREGGGAAGEETPRRAPGAGEEPADAEPADAERQSERREELDVDGGAGLGPRRDVDLEMELELARRRRAAHHEVRRAAAERAGDMEMQRRYAAAAGMYGGFGDRPPPNCPAQAVLVWMGCQVLILMDIVTVPSKCTFVGNRDQCITCEVGADLDYDSCVKPWPGVSPDSSSQTFAQTNTLDFYNECCTEHPDCCTPSGALPAHRPFMYVSASAEDSSRPTGDGFIKAMVDGVPCCDALCGAHGTDATMTGPELEAQEVAVDFFCHGFTVWYLSYVGVYIASVVVVGNAAKNDGSASACLTLTLGIIILYLVRTQIVPYGDNRHNVIYPAGPFFEYAVMSDLFLWMMTRRARAMRLHYERTTRHMNRIEDREAARQRDRDELDRAAERLAQQPIEPLPPVKPVDRGALGAIVEGIAMEDMDADCEVTMTANPMMRASVSVGDVVHQRELQQPPDSGAGVGSEYAEDEESGIEPLPLRVASSAVFVQPPSRSGGAAGNGSGSGASSGGAPVMTVLARLTPPSSPSATPGAVVEGVADPATRPRQSMAAVEDDADDAGDDIV